MIADEMYVVDPRLTADAILARIQARAIVPELQFGNERRAARVRSFSLSSDVPSFRLNGFARRGHPHRVGGRSRSAEYS